LSLRIFGALLGVWWLLATWAGAQTPEWTHSPPQWRTLARGLHFALVQVYRDLEEVDTLAVVKIDPAFHMFRVFHRTPRSISAWQEDTQAVVLFNASYFNAEGKPVGLVVADGVLVGPLKNPQMRGMFVAEPQGVSPDLPRATILDLSVSRINPKELPWSHGVQSFPLLFDAKGRIKVKKSDKRSRRTVIAVDRQGNILVFNTGGDVFTLYELAHFLKASTFELDIALNLDGGQEAQLLVKTGDFVYLSPTSWQSRLHKWWTEEYAGLPTVVGVFPRTP
jgi:uncharacterized protein YigE (DUF2233 family)